LLPFSVRLLVTFYQEAQTRTAVSSGRNRRRLITQRTTGAKKTERVEEGPGPFVETSGSLQHEQNEHGHGADHNDDGPGGDQPRAPERLDCPSFVRGHSPKRS